VVEFVGHSPIVTGARGRINAAKPNLSFGFFDRSELGFEDRRDGRGLKRLENTGKCTLHNFGSRFSSQSFC